MKQAVTRFFSACFALMLGIGCCSVPANAKVIEPEVVKTESWTTSYYIDDDMDTRYPYIQCEADIYNDGTIKLYMWNTHEWDGFATVSHTVTIVPTIAVSDSSMLYSFKLNGKFENSSSDGRTIWCYPITKQTYIERKYTISADEVNILDVSFYPETYSVTQYDSLITYTSFRSGYYQLYYEYCNANDISNFYLSTYDYKRYVANTPLPNLMFDTNRPKQEIGIFKPTSKTNLTEKQNFRLYGHDITITPELLSGKVTAEPELTEQEKQLTQLEEENKALKNKLQSYEAFDSDGDGFLTSADAQMILVYYAEYLAGATSGKTGAYAALIQTFKGQ